MTDETAFTPPTASMTLVPWLVWSNEHNSFWSPNRCGYTRFIERAGRYSRDEAEAICRSANWRGVDAQHRAKDPDCPPPEICFPAPEAAGAIETAEKALTVGTPVRCVADECPAEWREDWRDWTGFIAGIHYEPRVGLNYTVSDVWPPEHNGDLSDGFREGQLVRDNR